MLDEIRLSVSGNLHHYRENTNIYVDLAVNLGLALVGVAVFVFASGWVSWIGAVWAILNVVPIVTWAVGI